MKDISAAISKLKAYCDSSHKYQQMLIPDNLTKALQEVPLDPLGISLIFRSSPPYLWHLFPGFEEFVASDTFKFYTNFYDSLVSFDIPPSKANFERILAHQSSGHNVLELSKTFDKAFKRLEKIGLLADPDEAQVLYNFLAQNPNDILEITACYVLLKQANMLTTENRQAVARSPRRKELKKGLEVLLKNLGEQDEAQKLFNLFISAYIDPGDDLIQGATLIKELNKAKLLHGTNHTKAMRSSELLLILQALNYTNTPVSQERFNHLLSLSPRVLFALAEEIKIELKQRRNPSLLWKDQYIDGGLCLLSAVAASPHWQKKDDIKNALSGYKAEIKQTERQKAATTHQFNSFFSSEETQAPKSDSDPDAGKNVLK